MFEDDDEDDTYYVTEENIEFTGKDEPESLTYDYVLVGQKKDI